MRHPDHPFTLFIERTLAAPRSKVWRCWTEPELLEQWYCPRPWQAREVELNLKPGGRFNSVFHGPQGERMPLTGIFLEIVPQERLVFTDAYSEGFFPRAESFMTGTVELSDTNDGKTRMIWCARHTSEETIKQHIEMGFEQGWNAAADQLDELAATL